MKRIITLLLLISLSASAFCVMITFEVSMKGSGVEYDSIFVVGEQTDWDFVQMEDQGDSLFSATINMNAGDSAAFYFITIGYWASNYVLYREIVPLECDYSLEYAGWEGDRGIEAPDVNSTFSYIWGSCGEPGVTAIEDANSKNSISLEVFPNPAEDFLNINLHNFGKSGRIDIMDIEGKTLKSYEFHNLITEYSVDVEDLTPGIYFIRVCGENELKYKKVVIN